MRYVCGPGVCAAVALTLAAGCAPDDLQMGMVPRLQVSTPSGEPALFDYAGVTFGAHWEVPGFEVTFAGSHRGIERNMVTVAATAWLGWALTCKPQTTPVAWLVLKPQLGVRLWNAVPEDFGPMLGFRTGFGVYLNEYNTIGLEYGWMTMDGTHDDDETDLQGLHFVYSLVF